jgi:hypothetical protein
MIYSTYVKSEVVPECNQYNLKVQYSTVYYSTYVYSEVVPECNQYNWKVKYSTYVYSEVVPRVFPIQFEDTVQYSIL